MTFAEACKKLQEICFRDAESLADQELRGKKEITARFDFPIHGRVDRYKIAYINKDEIVLRNDECARPEGHH